MVIQERSSNSVTFWNRTFDEYAVGFGDPNHDHWLGLEHVQELIRAGYTFRLRMEVKGDRCTRSRNVETYSGDWDFDVSFFKTFEFMIF